MSTNDYSHDGPKQSADDLTEGVMVYRSILAAAADEVPGTLVIPGSQPAGSAQFMKNTASRILARLFVQAAAVGETLNLSVLAFPQHGAMFHPENKIGDVSRHQAGGLEIGVLSYTFSGREFTNIHPLTGTPVAATKFFAASAVTATWRQHTDIIKFAPDLADAVNYPATNRELLTIIDTFGQNGVYLAVTGHSGGMLQLIAGLQRLT